MVRFLFRRLFEEATPEAHRRLHVEQGCRAELEARKANWCYDRTMYTKACLICVAVLAVGCGTSSSAQGTGGNAETGGTTALGSGGAAGGMTGTGGLGTSNTHIAMGGKATGGGTGEGGTVDAGTASAGNPSGSCSAGIPARGQPVNTATATTKIGAGTPGSCDFAQLQTAVAKGGTITFDCGAAAHTILVTATLKLPITKSTVIDGANRITLDGGGAVQIMRFDGTDWMTNTNTVTLQHITLVGGKASPTEAIPTAPAPCSQGYNDGEGGAVYVLSLIHI